MEVNVELMRCPKHMTGFLMQFKGALFARIQRIIVGKGGQTNAEAGVSEKKNLFLADLYMDKFPSSIFVGSC